MKLKRIGKNAVPDRTSQHRLCGKIFGARQVRGDTTSLFITLNESGRVRLFGGPDLAAAQANGLPAIDLPALGSGLQRLGGNYYVGVSDRGPTFTRTTPTPGRVFPLPGYTPMIVFFKAAGDEIQPDAFLPIVVDDLGTPATGVSNSATEDSVPFASPAATVQLPFNANGLDIEDLHMLGDGKFLLVDEYSPSVVVRR